MLVRPELPRPQTRRKPMTDEFSFLESIRQALKVPQGVERSKSIAPELFAKTDRSALIDRISSRSFSEKLALIDELQSNCAELDITLHLVDSVKDAEDVVVELARSKRPEFSHNRHIIQHDHPDIQEMKLWKRFNRESVTVHTTYQGDKEVKEKTIASYIGITAPDIVVAESATLMQLTRPGCPRSTSLVPSIHIGLVKSENLVADLSEGYALLERKGPKNSFVFISGPSKSADIEAHLVHGAHGPKEVHIILLKEPEQATEPVQEPEVAEETTPDEAVESEERTPDAAEIEDEATDTIDSVSEKDRI